MTDIERGFLPAEVRSIDRYVNEVMVPKIRAKREESLRKYKDRRAKQEEARKNNIFDEKIGKNEASEPKYEPVITLREYFENNIFGDSVEKNGLPEKKYKEFIQKYYEHPAFRAFLKNYTFEEYIMKYGNCYWKYGGGYNKMYNSFGDPIGVGCTEYLSRTDVKRKKFFLEKMYDLKNLYL